VRVALRHRAAWRTLIGFEGQSGPLAGALQNIHDLMRDQGVSAGMALMSDDEPARVMGWASVFVLAPDAVTAVELRGSFDAHPSAVSATTVRTQHTPLGQASRQSQERAVDMPSDTARIPRTVVMTHVLWTWAVTSPGDGDTAPPWTVALSSESPSPHPSDAVIPLVDELALGLTLDDAGPEPTPLTTQKEGS
jgi:hypothetical protein